MSDYTAPFLVFLGVVASVIGSIVVARLTSQAAAKASPYSELAKRVVQLEERVQALEAEASVLRADKALLVQERDAALAERDALRAQLSRERAENRAYIRRLIEAANARLADTSVPLPVPPDWYVP